MNSSSRDACRRREATVEMNLPFDALYTAVKPIQIDVIAGAAVAL